MITISPKYLLTIDLSTNQYNRSLCRNCVDRFHTMKPISVRIVRTRDRSQLLNQHDPTVVCAESSEGLVLITAASTIKDS